MHPKYKRKAAKAKAAAAKSSGVTNGVLDELKQIQSRKFPGLSVPDQEWTPAQKYIEERNEPLVDKLPPSISADNTLAELAAVAARRNRPSAEDYLDSEPLAKRPRNGDDGYGSRSVDNGYASRRSDAASGSYGQDRGRQSRQDEKPILYKIYDGSVSNIRDFGAFVSLDGVQGRAEGELAYDNAHDRHGSCVQHHRITYTDPI
jgi:ATP-dependent RNA helicase DHX8/PRP22